MKNTYIEIMDRAFRAYTKEQISDYYERVKTEGLTEHGFPRLASNLGILICHGRHTNLLPLFIDLMDLCCEQMPKVHAANDFSVREIVTCLVAVVVICGSGRVVCVVFAVAVGNICIVT